MWKKQGFDTEAEKWQKIILFLWMQKNQSGKLCDSICVCRLRKIYGEIQRLGNENFWRRIRKHGKYYNFRDKKEGAGALHRLFI